MSEFIDSSPAFNERCPYYISGTCRRHENDRGNYSKCGYNGNKEGCIFYESMVEARREPPKKK